jgi:hypothetical protein
MFSARVVATIDAACQKPMSADPKKVHSTYDIIAAPFTPGGVFPTA